MPGKSHGQRSLAGHSIRGRKESDRTEGLTHTHTYTHAHVHTQAHTHTCTHAHIHAYTHAYMCTYTHAHTYTHTHTHILEFSRKRDNTGGEDTSLVKTSAQRN